MKKIKIFLAFLMLVMLFNCSPAQNSMEQNNTSRSIAIILKLTGDENKISNTEVYSSNVYAGKAKNIAEPDPRAASLIHIKAFDEMNRVIFDGYFDDPLHQKLESFEENGKVTNTVRKEISGYINIRFALNSAVKNITLNCYAHKKNTSAGNEKEELVSTNQITVK